MEDPIAFRELLDTTADKIDRQRRADSRLGELVVDEFVREQVRSVIESIEVAALAAAKRGERTTQRNYSWKSLQEAESFIKHLALARSYFGSAIGVALEGGDQVDWTDVTLPTNAEGGWDTTVNISFTETSISHSH